MVVGVSERQCYRIKARVKQQGVKGVIHGNRGRPSWHKVKEKTVRRVVQLGRGKYHGFNDHHLTEKLKEQEQNRLSSVERKSVASYALKGSPLPESAEGSSTEAAGSEEPLRG